MQINAGATEDTVLGFNEFHDNISWSDSLGSQIDIYYINIMYVTVDQLLVIIGDGHPTFNRESPMEIGGCLDPTSSTYQSMVFLGGILFFFKEMVC